VDLIKDIPPARLVVEQMVAEAHAALDRAQALRSPG
jgi:hypothetical protein